MAGEWNGVPFQPHTLKIAGSVSASLRSALSGRPLDVQRPVPAMIMQNGSTGKAAPSYGVTGRFESGFCNRVSSVDTVHKGKLITVSSGKTDWKKEHYDNDLHNDLQTA